MSKKTLLEIVQDILSEADGDEVNSITDTVESEQCARVVRTVFEDIVDIHDLEHTKTLKQLTATSSSTPNVMERPEGLHTIEWVRYDKRLTAGAAADFEIVHYQDPDTFIGRVMSRNTGDSNVDAVTLSTGAVIPVINDKAPTYFTVMDEGSDELVFDSYDSDLETNLQASKSLVYGIQKPTLTLSDTSVFTTLPTHLQQLVVSQARALYFDLYKDGITSEIDRKRRRAEVRSQRQRHIVKNQDNNTGPNYGRK